MGVEGSARARGATRPNSCTQQSLSIDENHTLIEDYRMLSYGCQPLNEDFLHLLENVAPKQVNQ